RDRQVAQDHRCGEYQRLAISDPSLVTRYWFCLSAPRLSDRARDEKRGTSNESPLILKGAVMPNELAKSPLGVYIEHCKKGELAYQVTADGKPVFFPRIVAPVTGGKLEWRVSKGLGTVHATTV